ncbi:hypothetical protein MPSI1_001298 [Malassezia psittaci]|uniref:Uncharacterized protein n=1 Tax=Malassezia psittaci TaxID=1821823 RepID=A0AAF0F892_9BASI|nr:hypothetical protein MPSI1_001298 [Malassezia psittaci]
MRVMQRGLRIVQSTGQVLSLLQVLFFLPLSLEHDQDTFLAFSASIAAFYGLLSTLRYFGRGTRMLYFVKAISMLQNVLIPMLLFLCARLYSPLPSSNPLIEALRKSGKRASPWLQPASIAKAFSKSELHAYLVSVLPEPLLNDEDGIVYPTWLAQSLLLFLGTGQYLLSRVPEWWYSALLYMSPVFSLLEGLSSLLVIQSISHLSRWLINDSDRSKRGRFHGSAFMRKLLSFGLEPSEVWQLLFLLLSAVVYVLSAVALYMCYDGATDGRSIAASAIGASVASTFWISAIAFAIRKGNVVETSLMFGYVVFNIYQLSSSLNLSTDPLQMVRNFKASHIQNQVPLFLAQSTSAMLDRFFDAVEHSLYVLSAANEVLPTTVIVSLVYRLMVLYSAIRVLPRLNSHHPGQPQQEILRRRQPSPWTDPSLSDTKTEQATEQKDAEHKPDPVTDSEKISTDVNSSKNLSENASAKDEMAQPTSPKLSNKQDPSTSSEQLESILMSAKEPGSEDVQDVAAYMQQAKPARSDAVQEVVEHAFIRAEKIVHSRLESESRGSTILKVLVTYSRFLLIAVYSHLLLLDQNHQIYWRLMTVFFALGLWCVELLLSKEDSYLVSMYE